MPLFHVRVHGWYSPWLVKCILKRLNSEALDLTAAKALGPGSITTYTVSGDPSSAHAAGTSGGPAAGHSGNCVYGPGV